MKIDEALAEVENRRAGRTMYQDRVAPIDEVLADEVLRLRAAYQHQLSRALQFKYERDAMTAIKDASSNIIVRQKTARLAASFKEK